MPEYCFLPAAAARFAADRFTKLEVARGQQLFVGLNCFETGQGQPVHTHADADKFYLVLSGNARMIVDGSAVDAAAGTLVWAPRGVPHGVERAHERTVLLIGMGPPPAP
jgi:quercetin dioxygenase-like cupin family protein